MEPDGLRAEAKRFRSAEPSRVIRGLDEDQTRKLLEAAAELLDTAAGQQEAMQRELEQLRSEGGQEAAGKEAIGKALLAATRAGEEIAAEARISAERIMTEAEARAAAILEQATAAAEERARESAATRLELERERTQVLRQAQEEADGIVANARREVEELQYYGEQLRSLVVDSRRRFVELAESALRHLEGVGLEAGTQHGDLLEELRPAAAEPSTSPVRGD